MFSYTNDTDAGLASSFRVNKYKRFATHEKGPYTIVDNAGPDQPALMPLFSAYRINKYYSLCRPRENVQIKLDRFARSPRPLLFAYIA